MLADWAARIKHSTSYSVFFKPKSGGEGNIFSKGRQSQRVFGPTKAFLSKKTVFLSVYLSS
jgi:preprotein translocase subunit SecG